MSNRLTKFHPTPLPATPEVIAFLEEESSKRKMSIGEFIADTFLEKYPHLRPVSVTPTAPEGEDTPGELHRLLVKLQEYPGYLEAWNEIKHCTGKPASYPTYLAWIGAQSKFIKRAGRPGGNQLLLYAVRQMMADLSGLKGKELTVGAVVKAAKEARAKFAHPNEILKGNENA